VLAGQPNTLTTSVRSTERASYAYRKEASAAPFLGHCRTAAEIALMRRVKAALDPRDILDSGKVLGAAGH
jgi:FAD/FMN-containing dehydrogenase